MQRGHTEPISHVDSAAERDARQQVEAREDILSAHILAMVYAGRGEEDAALRWLEEAYSRGWRLKWYLEWDPLFESLRDDPQFERLLERIGRDLAFMRDRARREGLVRQP